MIRLQRSALVTHVEVRRPPPLVFIHGLGTSSRIWAELGRRLPGWNSLFYDLRGAGATSELSRRELSISTWTADLRELLVTMDVPSPVLLGHSLGASIALSYALSYPDDVAALVLIGADPHLAQLAPRMQRSIELIGSHGFESWVNDHWILNPPFSQQSLATAPEILDLYREILLGNDPNDYVRTCTAIATAADLTEALTGIAQPTLVISGDADDRTPIEQSRWLTERMPDARLVELPGVGHTPPLEAPDAVAVAVRNFLSQL